jgi:predicted dinucleotide-binding enzyme
MVALDHVEIVRVRVGARHQGDNAAIALDESHPFAKPGHERFVSRLRDQPYRLVDFSAASVAKALPSWEGKRVIDATNAFGVLLEELGGLPSSAVIAKAFAGAKFVKGFNHLPAAALAADPIVEGGHRVIFLSGDDEDATAPVAALAKQLGFAPVKLGKLNEGGTLVQARGNTWAQLIFQDLFKKE